MRIIPAFPAVVIGFSLVAGCNTGVTLAKAKVQEEIKHTSALTKTGRVQLDNVNGKVRVTGWGRSEIQVVAVKRADRQADLDAVKIQIDAKPDHIRIHTKYPNSKSGLWKRSNSTSVDYEIKVPTEAQLESVETVNGSLELDGVYGSVHASTVNGK